MTEQNAMTDEMILVPRAELIDWAKEWKNAYGPLDGTDCVTPFDWHLLKTPVKAQPVGVDELVERMRQAPDRLWTADLVGQKISVERMRDILTFALAQQPAAPVEVLAQRIEAYHWDIADKPVAAQFAAELRALAEQPAAPVGEEAVDRVAAALLGEATDEPWTVAGVEHEGPDRDYYRKLARKVLTLAQQPASDGGFTAADMMDARQEGRKEAQQPAPVEEEVKVLARHEHLVLIARALGDALSAHEQLNDEAGWSPLDLAQLRKAAQAVYEMGGEP